VNLKIGSSASLIIGVVEAAHVLASMSVWRPHSTVPEVGGCSTYIGQRRRERLTGAAYVYGSKGGGGSRRGISPPPPVGNPPSRFIFAHFFCRSLVELMYS